MNESSFLGLIHNITLLLSLALLFDRVAYRWQIGKTGFWQIPIGLLIGGIGLVLMQTPWVFMPGVIFDTRSVLLSISGLFFGTVPTLIAMGMTAAFRIYQGGIGALMGVCVILAAGMIGIAWRHRRRQPLHEISTRELILFGITVHIVMLALVFTLPADAVFQVFSAIIVPVVVIYPLGTALLGALMVNRLRRERTAEALLENQERLTLAVRASNIGFFDRNLVTQEVHFSPEWKSQIGYAVDEIRDESGEWENRIHPDDLPEVRNRQKDYLNGLSPNYEAEYRLRHRDGSYRWILARGILQFDPNGKAVRLLGCHIDITHQKQNEEAISRDIAERKQALKRMQESERHYRSLFENMLNGFAYCQMLFEDDLPYDFIYLDVNQAFEQLTGLKSVIGKRVSEVIPGIKESDPKLFEIYGKVALTGKPEIFEMYVEALNDWYSISVYSPQREYIVTIFDVITYRKRSEEDMQAAQAELQRLLSEADQSRLVLLSLVEDQKQAQERINQLNVELEQRVRDRTLQLESANKELEAFAYSVSHDLRAPLRAMDGFSAALLSDYPDQLDEKGRHYLERIQEASRRMGQLINDLLNLSRVTRTDFKRQRVDLSGLAQQVINNLNAQDPQRAVEWDIAPDLIVQGDVQLLRIVMENLLNNAYKFSSKSVKAQIGVGAVERAGEQVYFVRDNGVGFDMEYAGKLFAPFQRLHNTQEFPGTGIGLVTVQRIIHRHGGRIWPEAELGRGAAFYFTLGGN
jgi:PAS domain S-box-containing protein